MNPNYYQPSTPYSPTSPPGPSPMHPAANPGIYPYYNTNWGPAQQQAFLHHANQMVGGGPSAAGPAATINNGGYQCGWLMCGIPCSQSFATFAELMVHVGGVHDVQGTAARKLVCHWWSENGYCGQKYRRDGFRRHIATHVRCSVLCPKCGKSFSRNDSMRSHLKKQHGKK